VIQFSAADNATLTLDGTEIFNVSLSSGAVTRI
jgi:hypothetical protein